MKSNIRTSISHPLEIQSVTPSGTTGAIGMTLCPGRKGSSASGGRWERDLSVDLEAVRAWKPDLAIALLDEHEFEGLGITDFRRDVAAAGLPWSFMPIHDGGVPGREYSAEWETLGPRVRNILRRGGRVLIHCRAGLGRTGMIAASILIEFGMTPQRAMASVRAARRDTIEPQQEAYVEACRPLRKHCSRSSGVAGSLYGAAAGDALGAAFEMVGAAQIERFLGEPFAWRFRAPMPGSLLSAQSREPGWPTDDTAMALSVADVIATANDFSADRFAAAFLHDLDRNTGRFAKLFWRGAPGIATTQALTRLSAGAKPATCGAADDGGNGAAMRAHPVGFLADRQEVLRVAAIQARVTHGHPAAIAAAQAVAVLVHDALTEFEPTLEPPEGIDDPTFLRAWQDAHLHIARGAKRLPAHLQSAAMSGWATVAAAGAIAYIYADEPQRAIAAAAASGGDTDTIATIVGSIVGARCGVEALDPGWIEGLKVREHVQRAVDLLTEDGATP